MMLVSARHVPSGEKRREVMLVVTDKSRERLQKLADQAIRSGGIALVLDDCLSSILGPRPKFDEFYILLAAQKSDARGAVLERLAEWQFPRKSTSLAIQKSVYAEAERLFRGGAEASLPYIDPDDLMLGGGVRRGGIIAVAAGREPWVNRMAAEGAVAVFRCLLEAKRRNLTKVPALSA